MNLGFLSPVPVETKVAAGSSVAAVTGMITWVLVTFVPAFQHGVPPQLATFLPYVVSALLGSIAAYMAPHTPRSSVSGEPAPAPASAQEPAGATPDMQKSSG